MRIKNRSIFFALSLSFSQIEQREKKSEWFDYSTASTHIDYVLRTTDDEFMAVAVRVSAKCCCLLHYQVIYVHCNCILHIHTRYVLSCFRVFIFKINFNVYVSAPFETISPVFFPILLNSLFDLMPYRIPSIRFTCWKFYTAYAVANSHCMRHEHSHKMFSCNFLDNFGFVWKKQKKKKREHK